MNEVSQGTDTDNSNLLWLLWSFWHLGNHTKSIWFAIGFIIVLPRNFITGDNVLVLLKKWAHFRKKWGHCGKKWWKVIWRSKISFPSLYIIINHILLTNNINKLKHLLIFLGLHFQFFSLSLGQRFCRHTVCHNIFGSNYINIYQLSAKPRLA